MRRVSRNLAAVLALFLTDPAAPGQTGTIAVVKNSSSLFSILNPATGAVTNHNIGAYLPGTGATASSVIFESSNVLQRRWLVGGTGFIGRVTFAFDLLTQTNTVGYSVLASVPNAHQLIGRNAAGDVFFADSATDQVMKLSPGGALSAVTTGPQPWGSGLLSGTIHSVSGELLLGSDAGRVFRLPPGATTATVFGPTQPLVQARIVNLVADPLSTGVVAVVRSTVSGAFNRFVRISATGAVQDLLALSAVDGLGLAVDPSGDFLISQASGTVLRVSNAGGIQFLAGTVSNPPLPATIQGIAVQGSLRSVLPHLVLSAPAPGAVDIDVLNGHAGSSFRILVSLQPSTPTGSGAVFGVGSDAFPQVLSPLIFGTFAGNGAGHLGFTGVPGGVTVDAVALDVSPASLLQGVSNVLRFTTL